MNNIKPFIGNTDAVAWGQAVEFVTVAATAHVSKAGDTMTGDLAMSDKKVTGLADPTAAQDAATKAYVDAKVAEALSSMASANTGTLAISNNKCRGDPAVPAVAA